MLIVELSLRVEARQADRIGEEVYRKTISEPVVEIMCCYCLLKGIGSRRACSPSAFPLVEVEDDCGPIGQEGEG
jgi:hypothetical protein